jgi:hypothetical protein
MSRHIVLALALCAGGGAHVLTPAVANAGGEPPRVEPKRPDAPEKVPAREVRRDIRRERRGPQHLTMRDFRDFIDWFDQALTLRALNHLTAIALHFAAHQPPRRAAVLTRQVYDGWARALPQVGPSFTIGFEGAGECDVDFDNPDVLATYFDDAASQIGDSIRWDEPCGNGVVRVDVLSNNHIHLSFEDLPDCITGGQFGHCSDPPCAEFEDEDCVPIVAVNEPRTFAGHDGTTTIRIRHRVGGLNQPFTLHSFANVGNEPVRVRYRTTGGDWFQWNSLAGNTVWLTSPFTDDVTQVLIVNAGTSLTCGPDWEAAAPGGCPFDATPIFIDDVSVSP